MKKQLTELVRQEAANLKKFAYKKELKNLDFNELNPLEYSRCIYGQMTGHCNSPRAIKLIRQCAEKVIESVGPVSQSNEINGSPKNLKRYMFWSPIEVFVTHAIEKKNKALIDYLKGETKTLDI